jgi:hypothetical protein
MSFSQQLETIVLSYIEKVSQELNIPKNDLLLIWNSGGSGINNNTSLGVNAELNKLSKLELQDMCKVKSLKVSGTKTDLIKRIEEFEVLKKGDQPVLKESSDSVLDKIAKVPVIEIRRNKFGNFEHSDTSFIFNQETNKVCGKQNPDGSISSLTIDEINICHKYKFNYDIPSNLNSINDKMNELNELDEEYVEVDEEELELEIEDDENEEEEQELEEEYE